MMAITRITRAAVRRVLSLAGRFAKRPGGARGPAVLTKPAVDHGRFQNEAADCTGVDGRPLASILTPGEAEAGVRPGDHRFLAR